MRDSGELFLAGVFLRGEGEPQRAEAWGVGVRAQAVGELEPPEDNAASSLLNHRGEGGREGDSPPRSPRRRKKKRGGLSCDVGAEDTNYDLATLQVDDCMLGTLNEYGSQEDLEVVLDNPTFKERTNKIQIEYMSNINEI